MHDRDGLDDAPGQGGLTIDGKVASDQLNRILSFFPRVDGKMALVFATDSTMLGVLAARITPVDLTSWFVTVPTALAVVAIFLSLLRLYWCAFPQLWEDDGSFVYFKAIACRSREDYVEAFGMLGEKEWREDLSSQIWANSRILTVKYRCVKHALILMLVAFVPWAVAVSTASLAH